MTGRQEIFQHAMNQGHSAAWDQMWNRAAGFYRQALDEFPDHPQALSSLGLALYELQDYEESLRVYIRAAQVGPGDPIPTEKIAQLYERLGNLEHAWRASLQAAEIYLKNKEVNKAIENWQRVCRINPRNLQARSRLAVVYDRIGEKDKAVAEYLAVASLLQAAGEVEKAARAVTQALQTSPNHEDAIQALTLLRDYKSLPPPSRPRGGTAPLRMAQVKQLEAPKADQSEPKADPIIQARQRALTALAGMLFEPGEDATSESASRRGGGLQNLVKGATGMLSRPVDRTKIVLHLSQVVDLQTHDQYEQAAEELERAIDAGLEHPAAYYDLAWLNAENGRQESAIRFLQHACKHPDFALGARLLGGELLCKQGRMREASIEFLEALKMADALVVPAEQSDDLRQLYEPIIEANHHTNDTEAHARLCENVRSLLLRPDWRENLARARAQMPERDPGGPLMPLAEIITEARSSQVIEAIARIYDLTNRGNLRTALEEAFYALQEAPNYLPLHTLIGELLLKAGQLQDGISKLLVVARAYSVRGEPQRAILMYRRVLELSPMDMAARSRLIEMLLDHRQVEDAIREYMDLAEVYYNLADLDMVRKTYTAALRIAQQPGVDRSLRIDILHRMADIDLQSLDWRQALRIFEQIRTLQPDDEKARASLVEINLRLNQEQMALSELDNYLNYLSEKGDLQRAIAFVEAQVKERPERFLLRRRLAELYRQAGRKEDAVREYSEVGEALLQAGERPAAAQVIETIIGMNPSNKQEYMQLLAEVKNGGG